MPQTTTATVRTRDGLALRYSSTGTGPALIFIHGWACDQTFWRAQVDAFASAYTVVTVDLPGHGGARAPAGARAWSMRSYGSDIVDVVAALGAERVALIGHSMGGPVALEAAIALGPDRCRFVLGIDTFTDSAFFGAVAPDEIARRCAVFQADFAGTMTAMVQAITGPEADRALVASIAATMAGNDAPAALQIHAALLAWDVVERWPDASCAIETINCTMLARASRPLILPGLPVHEIDGPGHFLMLETPERFNALVRAVLTRAYPP